MTVIKLLENSKENTQHSVEFKARIGLPLSVPSEPISFDISAIPLLDGMKMSRQSLANQTMPKIIPGELPS